MDLSLEHQIDACLEEIHQLLSAISPLIERARRRLAELAQAEELYAQRLKPLDEQISQLTRQRDAQKMRLRPPPRKPSPPIIEPAVNGEGSDREKEPIPPELPAEPPPLRKDARQENKLALRDYFVAIMGRSQEAQLKIINAMLVDPQTNAADMLESLTWEDNLAFWKERLHWETPEEQLARLSGWRAALQPRPAYWQGRLAELDEKTTQPNYLDLIDSDPDRRNAYLVKEEARKNQLIARLLAELRALEAEPDAHPPDAHPPDAHPPDTHPPDTHPPATGG